MNPGTGHKWSGLRVVQVQRLEKGVHPGEAGPLPTRMLSCGP